MTLPLHLADPSAELMRLWLRYQALAEEFGEVRDPRFQHNLARVRQELVRAFAVLDEWRQLRGGSALAVTPR
jgi:hypothetical protein